VRAKLEIFDKMKNVQRQD